MSTHSPCERWVFCTAGHTHWGAAGAAGLLLWRDAGSGPAQYLLIERSGWVHEGGTWSIPGGARQAGESVADAAHREAREELGALPPYRVETVIEQDCGGGWAFSTVLAEAQGDFLPAPNSEVSAVAWVASTEMRELALHPGFARFLDAHTLR